MIFYSLLIFHFIILYSIRCVATRIYLLFLLSVDRRFVDSFTNLLILMPLRSFVRQPVLSLRQSVDTGLELLLSIVGWHNSSSVTASFIRATSWCLYRGNNIYCFAIRKVMFLQERIYGIFIVARLTPLPYCMH